MTEFARDSNGEPRPADQSGAAARNTSIGRTDAEILLAITDLILAGDSLRELFENLAPLLQELTDCTVVSLAMYDSSSDAIVAHLWKKGQEKAEANIFPVDESPSGWVWQHQDVITIPDLEGETRFGQAVRALLSWGARSYSVLPISTANRRFGTLGLGRNAVEPEEARDLDYLARIAQLLGMAMENRELQREWEERKNAQPERRPEKVQDKQVLSEIIGSSGALKSVLDYAAIVASTDTTVLISGETGTGKERIARAIHAMSPRGDRSFIKMNCAAIPTGLLESELFGHEKGAFTGAVTQKVGRLELADKGTLLLDEVGEIPLELQPKLLRVLQDQEFERLGGTKTIRVDVRLLAATNRDLPQAVSAKQFRSDLFYRLHVFPLHLPPLRERREDIPLLVRHFVGKCAARLKKQIDFIPDEALQVMMNWPWPGNIRELENFIERSVILSDDNRLRAPLDELRQEKSVRSSDAEGTLRDRERGHIVEVLRQTHGVLSGPGGAAIRLGLKRTTLQYKLQKLGILRGEYLD